MLLHENHVHQNAMQQQLVRAMFTIQRMQIT